MRTLWFDCETFSECDLKAHSTHRYAEHESTEIIVAQYAIDDGEPVVIDCTEEYWRHYPPAHELRDLLADPRVHVVAHNSAFDRTLLRRCWGVDVPVERWRDTMVKALAHGLPGGLDKVGAVLGLEDDKAKDKRGRDLIQLFCKLQPKGRKLRRATRETHPEEWGEFLAYSAQDIVAMRACDQRLPSWNMRDGHDELALWHLDQRINDRGFAVDLDLARAAIDAVAVEQARLKKETQEATDGLVSSPSKRDQLLTFILAEYGVELPDMRADTLRRRMEDPELPEGVKLLLSLRLEATKTSTAKYKAALNMTSADGRMRNTSQFCGASRTGRWAHRGFQPGNQPRPDLDLVAAHFDVARKDAEHFLPEYLDQGVAALKGGFVDVTFNNIIGLTANLVRGCIVAPPGRKLCVADLANIEGRGLAFLGNEDWKLKAFKDYDTITGYDDNGKALRAGPDLYVAAYARAFNIDPSEVGKSQRQIGKVMELGLGYGGGVAAFITFAAVYGMDLDELAESVWATASVEMIERAQDMLAWFKKQRKSTHGLSDRVWVACEVLVLSWREAHPATVALWKAIDDAMREAIQNPGVVYGAGRHLKVRRDGAWLRVRLPSGRYLCYLNPRVDEDGISYFGVDQYSRQWRRIRTYGGKGAEQATQGFARDVFAGNAPGIEEAGYELVLGIHDEWLAETPDTDEFTGDGLAALLARQPTWAPGLPLAAAGFSAYRYSKG